MHNTYDLYRMQQQIASWAREYGLDFFDLIFEVVDYRKMNEVAAYGGFPVRYPHWRFGMEFEKMFKSHTYGLSMIYELVINNDPAYAYLLDYDDLAAKSSQTYGFRFGGAFAPMDNFKILYLAEYAMQSDYQDNPADFDADYYHINGGFKIPDLGSVFKNLTAKIGYEYQGSDNGVSFKTPLGTNHAFQGWADQFLVTPSDGVVDLYGALGTTLWGVNLLGVYHQFDAAKGSADYGNEIDAQITKAFGEHYSLLAAYANYFANDFKTDTWKFWLQAAINF